MRVLLDTHAFLWFIGGDPHLSVLADRLIGDPENQRLLSIASVCEIAIKIQRGNLALAQPMEAFIPEQMARNQIDYLEITPEHAMRVGSLGYGRLDSGAPHKDPFDRLIVAQSLIEAVPLISIETVFDQYGVNRRW